VARGDKFVFAQTLTDVIKFLDLKIKQQERLSPEQLMQKMDLVLTAAARYIRQIPQAELDKPFRNRNRPKRVLGHHVFRIVEGFLESMKDGKVLSYDRIMEDATPATANERGYCALRRVCSRARRTGGAATMTSPASARWRRTSARTRCTWCSSAPSGTRRSTRAS
jgi:hypothetical protein